MKGNCSFHFKLKGLRFTCRLPLTLLWAPLVWRGFGDLSVFVMLVWMPGARLIAVPMAIPKWVLLWLALLLEHSAWDLYTDFASLTEFGEVLLVGVALAAASVMVEIGTEGLRRRRQASTTARAIESAIEGSEVC